MVKVIESGCCCCCCLSEGGLGSAMYTFSPLTYVCVCLGDLTMLPNTRSAQISLITTHHVLRLPWAARPHEVYITLVLGREYEWT